MGEGGWGREDGGGRTGEGKGDRGGRWGREDGKKEQQIKKGKNEEEDERSNRVKKEIAKAEVHCTLYPDAMMQLSAYF